MSVQTFVDRMKSRLGYDSLEDPPENQSLLQQIQEGTTLTRTQRLVGAALCLTLGAFLTLLAPTLLFSPRKFAVTYTLGNILSMGSTLFLVGPAKQLSNMFSSRDRSIAVTVFLSTMILTLYVALGLHSTLLALPCILVQTVAMIWYLLSYIPWLKNIVLSMLGRQTTDEY